MENRKNQLQKQNQKRKQNLPVNGKAVELHWLKH